MQIAGVKLAIGFDGGLKTSHPASSTPPPDFTGCDIAPFRADTTAEAATLLCPMRICTYAIEVVRRPPPAPVHMLSHAAPHRFTTQTRHATLLPPSHRNSDAITTPARAAQLHRNGLDACYSSARERPAATIEAVL